MNIKFPTPILNIWLYVFYEYVNATRLNLYAFIWLGWQQNNKKLKINVCHIWSKNGFYYYANNLLHFSMKGEYFRFFKIVYEESVSESLALIEVPINRLCALRWWLDFGLGFTNTLKFCCDSSRKLFESYSSFSFMCSVFLDLIVSRKRLSSSVSSWIRPVKSVSPIFFSKNCLFLLGFVFVTLFSSFLCLSVEAACLKID